MGIIGVGIMRLKHPNRHSRLNRETGFTLVEVLVAVLLFAITILSFISVLNTCTYLDSYSRHKIQAMYVAQRIIEEQRRQLFSTLASQNYGVVSLDTKGTFATSADDYLGNAIITVTAVDANRKKVKVEVNWEQRSVIGTVTKKEFLSTDIGNEAQLN